MKNKEFRRNISLILEAISFLLLFVNEAFIKGRSYVLYTVLLAIGVTLSTNVLSVYISDKFKSDDLEIKASNMFKVLKHCQNYGLYCIETRFPLDNEEIRKDFIDSKKIYLVMNDAKRFLSDNTLLIEERMKKKNVSTTIVLQDYEQEDVMAVLTRKNGHDNNPDYYKTKISEVINYHIKSLKDKSDAKHNLSLCLNSNYNTLAIIMTDNYAMYSIYRIASGKTEVPHFIFKQGDKEYDLVKRDVDNVVNASKNIVI